MNIVFSVRKQGLVFPWHIGDVIEIDWLQLGPEMRPILFWTGLKTTNLQSPFWTILQCQQTMMI